MFILQMQRKSFVGLFSFLRIRAEKLLAAFVREITLQCLFSDQRMALNSVNLFLGFGQAGKKSERSNFDRMPVIDGYPEKHNKTLCKGGFFFPQARGERASNRV